MTETLEQAEAKRVKPHLRLELRHRIGALRIDVAFELTQPWTILFGPSGSGKTTILRAIAGLLRPEEACIECNPKISGEVDTRFLLVDTAQGYFLPAHRRSIPLASQKANLFPHLTVLKNLRYGYPGIGSPEEEDYRESVIASLPKLFRIEHVVEKRPDELSGGEAQRVNLARAVAAHHCRLLLLDEPFTGLDLELRDKLIANLLEWRARYGIPVLSVTHDVGEAFQLGAEVIKLEHGRVMRQGPAAEVLADERTRLMEQLNGDGERFTSHSSR